ncbi:MAG: hypothetical protein OEY59_04805 [Deltaproteobacteria bacterium]|nr:hypothetical protein [Deltaproteobacteria bacterium]
MPFKHFNGLFIKPALTKLVLIGLLGVLLFGCKSSDAPGPGTPYEPSYYALCIWNQSLYELRHVFVHRENQNFKDTDSIISSNLGLGESVTVKLIVGYYRVTVTRLKQVDGRLLAFTTAEDLNLRQHLRLEYFNEYFRETYSDSTADVAGCHYDPSTDTITR